MLFRSQIHGIVSMSLLSGYKKKTSYDGYESLQLVDSSGDFNNGSRSGILHGGSIAATLGGPKAGPLCEDDYSTMDSSGKRLAMGGGVQDCCRIDNTALLHVKGSTPVFVCFETDLLDLHVIWCTDVFHLCLRTIWFSV